MVDLARVTVFPGGRAGAGRPTATGVMIGAASGG
jgi:hypothetical protein